jgi:hypothetical protein
MNKLALSALVGLSALIATSCTFKEQISFNKDFSGSMKWGIEIPEGEDSSSPGDDEQSFEEFYDIVNHMEAIPGIHDAEVEEGDGGTFIKYSFDNLDALNKSYYELGFFFVDEEADSLEYVASHKGFTFFSENGKKFMYRQPPMDADDIDSDGEVPEAMWEMFNFEIVLSFEQKIKKVTNKNIEVINDHTMIQRVNIKEMIDDPKLMNFDVHLK